MRVREVSPEGQPFSNFEREVGGRPLQAHSCFFFWFEWVTEHETRLELRSGDLALRAKCNSHCALSQELLRDNHFFNLVIKLYSITLTGSGYTRWPHGYSNTLIKRFQYTCHCTTNDSPTTSTEEKKRIEEAQRCRALHIWRGKEKQALRLENHRWINMNILIESNRIWLIESYSVCVGGDFRSSSRVWSVE